MSSNQTFTQKAIKHSPKNLMYLNDGRRFPEG